ncbi:kinase-like domain-containing protein [Rhizophagus clarus]|nr:kinase-like domain-containing protein [Rhizophagus clarus]
MEFINAPYGNNNLIAEFHPQVCYTSRLLGFTSSELNEILEIYDESSEKLNETEESECLDCIVDNIKLSDSKTDKD